MNIAKIKKGLIWFLKSWLGIIPLLFFLDILSKQLFEKVILKTDGNTIVVIPHFISFTLTHNLGAAWGIFAGMDWLLITFSVVCGILMVAFLIYKYKTLRLSTKIALMLMISGAFGNLIDRAFYPNGVIDFIEFTFIDFPIFNLADAFLVIGVIVLVIGEIVNEIKDHNKKGKNQKDDEDEAFNKFSENLKEKEQDSKKNEE